MAKYAILICLGLGWLSMMDTGWCADVPVSPATEECLGCHESIHPGIVEGWRKSRHAMTTPQQAMSVKGPGLKVSSKTVPESLLKVSVGCAECHMLRPDQHTDSFEHNEYKVHVVVSPPDCATCHSQEADQFAQNLMSHAHSNLSDNPLYQTLQHSILGRPVFKDDVIALESADDQTKAEACYYCHGTQLKRTGTQTRDTAVGEMEFPVISGWPNQGVGRVNLDGSLGACSACHTRHSFSIATARKPYTCMECHIGPDVPAYKVYAASKHGNIFASKESDWNFEAVPWTLGKDITAPTCATCHISLTVNTDGNVVSERTHRMNDRLPWRIYGLIYAHPHPGQPDTTIIRNKDGLPLPTDFDGGLATAFLIDEKEQRRRTETMQAACRNCHSAAWVEGNWKRFENTIGRTNADIATATGIMQEIWRNGFAMGPSQGANAFDEAVERQWSDTWLFYANTIRFASAMAGGGDYGVFAGGRYQLSQGIQELYDWLELRKRLFTVPQATPAQKEQ